MVNPRGHQRALPELQIAIAFEDHPRLRIISDSAEDEERVRLWASSENVVLLVRDALDSLQDRRAA